MKLSSMPPLPSLPPPTPRLPPAPVPSPLPSPSMSESSAKKQQKKQQPSSQATEEDNVQDNVRDNLTAVPTQPTLTLHPITPNGLLTTIHTIFTNWDVPEYDVLKVLLKFPSFVREGLLDDPPPPQHGGDLNTPGKEDPGAAASPKVEEDEDSEDEEERMLREALALSLSDTKPSSSPTSQPPPSPPPLHPTTPQTTNAKPDEPTTPQQVQKNVILAVVVKMLKSMPPTKADDELVSSILKSAHKIVSDIDHPPPFAAETQNIDAGTDPASTLPLKSSRPSSPTSSCDSESESNLDYTDALTRKGFIRKAKAREEGG
mmetsp:Transcript_10613/g.21816  ORF Transcript_10613/g.21816 Transcript_10613/m.21816 type:complete len:317 (+) Transcript_10613:103-1053(+)